MPRQLFRPLVTNALVSSRGYLSTSSCHSPSSRLLLAARPPFLPRHTPTQTRTMASATSFYDFETADSTYPPLAATSVAVSMLEEDQSLTDSPTEKGEPFPLSSLQGKVVLVVNTASKCGFTPQFEGLEKLWQTMKSRYPDDFTILGFPCNQFGNQDPGSNDEIQSFCQVNYGVTFPVLGKLDVNGNEAAPVFTWLKEQMPGVMGLKRVKWNFEKFLVSADGKVVTRWSSMAKPDSLEKPIVEEIEKARKEGTLASLKKGGEGPEQAKLS